MTDETDFDPENPENLPVLSTKKKGQRIHLPNGNTTQVEITEPPSLPPVYHDTPEENQIDSELAVLDISIKNVNKMWKACRNISDAKDLALALAKLLETRRRLNKRQLGASNTEEKKTTWHID